MRNVSGAFRVGILLVVAIVGGWLLYRTVVQRAGTQGQYRVYALFRDASGLVPRSRITMAGIPVGTIDTIRLQDGLARVDMNINKDVELYEDATVSRKSASLLGEYLLVLTPGAEGQRRLVDGDRVRVLQEGSSTDDILNNVNAITQRVRQVVDRVGDVFGTDEGRRQMADALRNLQEVSAEVNRTVHANSEAITHAVHNIDEITGNVNQITRQGRPEVEQILHNVNDASRRVDQILARNQPGIDDTVDNVREVVRTANAASQDLRQALQHINSITAGVDRGEGTVGRLVRDDTLINDVESTVEGINNFVEPLARLQTIVGLRAEYNFLTNSLKSYIDIRIQPREDQYIFFQLVSDTRGYTSRRRTVHTSTNPNDPHTWTETEETTQDQLLFTLQFARRIGPATFRFGIMESTGGIGVDFHFFRDTLEIRTDLFAFSNDVYPRLRMAAAYEIIRRAWIIGGVDDILNGPRTDFYLGAELRFNDEDLRAILLFAGGLVGGVARQ